MVPVYFGGALRMIAEKTAGSPDEADGRRERGVLFGSGLVGGEGLFGVLIAGYAAYMAEAPEGYGFEWAGEYAHWASAGAFALLIAYFWHLTRKKS